MGVPGRDDAKAYTYCKKACDLTDDLRRLTELENCTFPSGISQFLCVAVFCPLMTLSDYTRHVLICIWTHVPFIFCTIISFSGAPTTLAGE